MSATKQLTDTRLVWWCEPFDALLNSVPNDTPTGHVHCPWRSYEAHRHPDPHCGWRYLVTPEEWAK